MKRLEDRVAIVTGGARGLGKAFCLALAEQGAKLVVADILDKEALHDIFYQNEFKLVIHLAAKAGVRPSIEDPVGYYKTNVEGTLNLLEECRKTGIKKIIFASSSSVYGNNEKVPFHEDDNVDFPISPYAATKKAGELLCHNHHPKSHYQERCSITDCHCCQV